MFTRRKVHLTTLALIVWFVWASPPIHAADIGTAFTYQGCLEKPAGTPLDDNCDLRLGLWDAAAGGSLVPVVLPATNPTTATGVEVADCVFTAMLDFGDVFQGESRWLEVEVMCPGDAGFDLLFPRQELTPGPYALWSASPWKTSGTALYYLGGNVGVGVPDPSDRLTVVGGRIYAAGLGLNSGYQFAHLNWYEDVDLTLKLTSAGGYNVAFLNDGNVGIGTAGPSNKLSVSGNADFSGNVGIGTTSPGSKLQLVADGDEFAIQCPSGGGTVPLLHFRNPSTGRDWILRHEESSFHIQTETGTGSEVMTFLSTGKVGIGDTTPTGKLTIAGDNSGSNLSSSLLVMGFDNQIMLQRSGVNGTSKRASISYNNEGTLNDGHGGLVFQRRDPDGTFNTNAMLIDLQNGFVGTNRLGGGEAPPHPLVIGTNGTNGNGAHCTIGGAWTNGSDRNSKQNFEEIDRQEILRRVVELPVTRWQYKGEPDEVRHIGPVAQDFYAAFATGADDRYIGTLDADGVALAAIQGLYEIAREKDCEIEELQKQKDDIARQNRELDARLAALEAIVEKLNDSRMGGAR